MVLCSMFHGLFEEIPVNILQGPRGMRGIEGVPGLRVSYSKSMCFKTPLNKFVNQDLIK